MNPSNDDLTIEILQLIFKAFSVTTQRLLIDHLPGGVHYMSSASSVLSSETASVPVHNVAPERDFAILDRYLREKPNAHLIALEAMILYSHKSTKWLSGQPTDYREKLLEAARTLAPIVRKKFLSRREEVLARRNEHLLEKQQNIAKNKSKATEEKEYLIKEIKKFGLWSSKEEVDSGLERVSKRTEKIKVLKLQFNFRRKFLGQTHSNKFIFKFSQNGKALSLLQLKENLYQYVTTSNDKDNHSASLEQVILNPELLIGRRIRHRFEIGGGELSWYDGKVIEFNHNTKEFEVAYDNEEETCFYTLIDDIKNGDLLLA